MNLSVECWYCELDADIYEIERLSDYEVRYHYFCTYCGDEGAVDDVY